MDFERKTIKISQLAYGQLLATKQYLSKKEDRSVSYSEAINFLFNDKRTDFFSVDKNYVKAGVEDITLDKAVDIARGTVPENREYESRYKRINELIHHARTFD